MLIQGGQKHVQHVVLNNVALKSCVRLACSFTTCPNNVVPITSYHNPNSQSDWQHKRGANSQFDWQHKRGANSQSDWQHKRGANSQSDWQHKRGANSQSDWQNKRGANSQSDWKHKRRLVVDKLSNRPNLVPRAFPFSWVRKKTWERGCKLPWKRARSFR